MTIHSSSPERVRRLLTPEMASQHDAYEHVPHRCRPHDWEPVVGVIAKHIPQVDHRLLPETPTILSERYFTGILIGSAGMRT